MSKLLSILVILGISLIFSVGVLAQESPVSLGIRVYENNESVSQLDVRPGEIIELKVYLQNAQDMAAISGTLVLPEADFTVIGIEQLFGICSAWDSKPVLSGRTVEFACAQGQIAASSGVIFAVKAVINSNFSAADISFQDELYLNTNKQFQTPKATPLKLQSVNVVQTSGGVSSDTGTGSVMVLLVNFVLIVGVILSLVMGYRYYRVNRQYAS
jgi:hypothetical protein